jgi:hypothetical protein
MSEQRNDRPEEEDEPIDEADFPMLPYCRIARINGKWYKGGRYYRALAIDIAAAMLSFLGGMAIAGWLIIKLFPPPC